MKDLILLHGALGTSQLFDPLVKALADTYQIHRFDFSGHGHAPFNEIGFGIEVFAGELDRYMAQNGLSKVPVFGYSMGGYVALYLESKKLGSFSQIVCLGTKFAWNPESARHETSRMVPEVIEEKVPKFATMLSHRHADWKGLMKATADMMLALGTLPLLSNEVLKGIDTRTIILLGDQDNMVSREESESAAQSLPQGTFKILNNCPHPIEKVDPEMLSNELKSLI